MIKRSFFLLSTATFFFWGVNGSIASDSFTTHTQHTPMELKPVSFSDMDNSYKTTSVCFLGGNCGDGGKFNKGDDYELDTAQQCKNEGFNITSCTAPKTPYGQCPYNDRYFKECKDLTAEKCRNEGYSNSCPEGNILDDTQVCPYDSSYKKCKCDPCSDYGYTYEEATSEGYIAGASCNSCDTMKYQRQNAPCNGFLSCECGGEIGASSCKSGTNTLFSQCKECVKCDDECPSGYYKTAGGSWGYVNGIGRDKCRFDEKTSQTECGTSCYQCQPPEKQFTGGEYCYSVSNCPEGYSYNNEEHDYVCNSGTCLQSLKQKYSNYFFDEKCTGKDSTGNIYQFDRPYVSCPYSNEPHIFSRDIINQSFYYYADFENEFRKCAGYCRSGQTLLNKTLKGDNLFLSLTYGGNSKNITVDGSVRVPYLNGSYGFNINGLILKQGATFENATGHMDNIILYPSATLIGGKLGPVTIAANTAATSVTLQKTLYFSGAISSANYLSGTNGNFYLKLKAAPDISSLTINRNPGGEIIIEPSSEKGYIRHHTLFKNPGIDTKVVLPLTRGGRTCLKLTAGSSNWLCSTESSEVVVTFKTDDVFKQVLPKCCSGNNGCPEEQWNGNVSCTGEAYCEGDCSY